MLQERHQPRLKHFDPTWQRADRFTHLLGCNRSDITPLLGKRAHRLMTRPVILSHATPVQLQGETVAGLQPTNFCPAVAESQLISSALNVSRSSAAVGPMV